MHVGNVSRWLQNEFGDSLFSLCSVVVMPVANHTMIIEAVELQWLSSHLPRYLYRRNAL